MGKLIRIVTLISTLGFLFTQMPHAEAAGPCDPQKRSCY